MNILIVKSNNEMHNDNILAIAKAFGRAEYKVAFWEVGAKPAFDVFSEMQPKIVISDKENNDRAYLKCIDRFRPRVISMHTIPICADVFTYGNFAVAAKELNCDYLSLISYDEKEYDKLPKIPDKNSFKIFSKFQKRIANYCGPLTSEFKPLAINSCSTFIPTNPLDALNAALLNKRILNKSPIEDRMLNRDYILKNKTCFHGAKFIDKNFDLSIMGK